MTKKMLQGIATGILLTTIIFAYNLYFTDNFYIIEEVPSDTEEAFTEQDLEEYLQNHDLIVIDKFEYEQLLAENTATEEVPETAPETPKEQVIVKEISFIVETGMSSSSVALLLEEKGIISDSKLFEQYLINHGLETKIKAGEYLLKTNMSLEQIVEELT